MSTIPVWKLVFVTLIVFFLYRGWKWTCFVLVPITICNKKHEQQINMKFLIKLKKKLWLSAISCWKRTLVRILYFIGLFLHGINGFLKSEKAAKKTNVQVNPSLFQFCKQWSKSIKLCAEIIVWAFGMIAETVNTDKKTVRKILHDKLNMKKVFAKLAPRNLTPDQKLISHQICSDFLRG